MRRAVNRANNVEDLRRIARRRLPKAVFDVIDGGSGDDVTLRGNRAAFETLWLRPRPLEDVSRVDLRTTVLGEDVSMPLLLDPCSFARMCHPQAELAVARAAGRAGTIYTIAGGASEKPEDIAKVAIGSLWYQLYMMPDQGMNEALLDRVEAAGYRTLVVTVDTPIKPYRELDLRNRIELPLQITPRLIAAGVSRPLWARDFLMGNSGSSNFSLTQAKKAYDNFADAIMHMKSVTRTDVAWLRERWKGPLVIKGVLRGEEVPELLALGVDGIVVSNHGGRNLDGVPPTLQVLPEIVEAADGRAEVLLDGGVRRGTDVVKALALGARAVLTGRPYMFALAAGGEPGVDRALELLRNEIHRAMAFCGVTSIAQIDASLVHRPEPALTPLAV
ncbi:alpha-hydroxy-acid oxidizing protein [Solirubrobacter sp. CPCC 204708]|uniref:Alpha-hydroxy-acid oxidizing protein n=1 Tax=Solirubrobacter deserti TaxID=2282478 RepID=A0ABT4RG08_9ACTN|nr:alpha-hydroxy acid oxidase [Solirubrobacter deserti]MBE2318183.1 alpha-hydroxy-acid oxidizing protein [Solirubrobacter deserti]MDA0137464.1 alpha-hydroxy-acid oxidizing protein [Solirubrobacter deserti]